MTHQVGILPQGGLPLFLSLGSLFLIMAKDRGHRENQMRPKYNSQHRKMDKSLFFFFCIKIAAVNLAVKGHVNDIEPPSSRIYTSPPRTALHSANP